MRDTRGFVRHVIFPIITAMIWGTAFVFQSTAADHMGCFTFNACRSAVGALSLLAVILVRRRAGKHSGRPMDRSGILAAVLCGVALALILSVPQLNIPFNKLMKFEFIKRKNNET